MSELTVKNLAAEYDGQAALDKINFSLPTGQTVAIVGPSGCGKSTLLKAVAGLIPRRGEILLKGEPLDPRRHKISFMPQDYGLLPWRTVRENILLPARVRRDKESQAGFDYLVERLGLSDLTERYPGEISGGERQRTALARTFLAAPDILLMDEPFSALDAITREAMQELFFSLWRDNAVTTLLVTHYMNEALYLGQRIMLMSWGGKIEAVPENPAFGTGDLSERPELIAFGQRIKRRIKEMGSKPCGKT